jgi:hypothetical protein
MRSSGEEEGIREPVEEEIDVGDLWRRSGLRRGTVLCTREQERERCGWRRD